MQSITSETTKQEYQRDWQDLQKNKNDWHYRQQQFKPKISALLARLAGLAEKIFTANVAKPAISARVCRDAILRVRHPEMARKLEYSNDL